MLTIEKSIRKDEKQISYTITTNVRSKRIRIAVSALGKVKVTKPRGVSNIYTENFVLDKFDWIVNSVEKINKRPQKLLAHFSAKDFKEYKKEAEKFVNARVEYFNQFYKYEVNNIKVRNQSSRWGSASVKKNLNFNYKIIFLPQELQDYIIVHELCHLKEMNHGKGFWNLVALQIPDHKIRRKKIYAY